VSDELRGESVPVAPDDLERLFGYVVSIATKLERDTEDAVQALRGLREGVRESREPRPPRRKPAEVRERRTGRVRRSLEDRRSDAPTAVATRILLSTGHERRSVGDRRSGVDRRAGQQTSSG
jgi:hypothetical protein